MGPQVLVYSRHPEAPAELLRRIDPSVRVVAAATREEAEPHLDNTQILFAWRFPPDLYGRMPQLKWVQSMGAGVEDILAAPGLSPDVAVTRIVDQFGGLIAEYVLSEVLALVKAHQRLRRQQAERRWEPFTVESLQGRTMGVAGLGSVGGAIVQRARAFDMRIFGLSRTKRPVRGVERQFGPDDWLHFVAELDYLVLALPLTPATHRVVDIRVLERMTPSAVLVNVGRGRLVDEAALIHQISSGRLGGAVLDVFEKEPLPPESPLWTLPGVIVTPHVSGPSLDEHVTTFFAENLRRHVAGEMLMGLVDRAAGY